MTPRAESGEREKVPLSRAAEYLLEECRMVLPGIQALFGFQLIAVFSPGFSQRLGTQDQRLHLLAIALVALSVALIMSPAAFHRQTDTQEITAQFIRLSTRLLLWSMPPLAIAICLDFYLIAHVILGGALAAVPAGAPFLVFLTFWFGLARIRVLRDAALPND
jgi:hypothetical protein